MKNKYFYPILFISCLICLFSCTSAPKHLAKAIQKDKPYVAEQTRLLWPCIVTGRDTVTVNTTDTVYDLIEAVQDSVYITTPGKNKPCTTFATITNTKYITEKVKDSTEVYLCLNNMEVQAGIHRDELAEKDVEIARQKLEIERKDSKITDLDKRNKRKGKRIIYMWLVIAGLTLWTFRKLIVRIIKPI